MTPEEEKLGERSHRDWIEQNNPNVVDEIYVPDCVIYNAHIPPPLTRGRDAFKAYGSGMHAGFPDLRIDHDMIVTDENGPYQAIVWTFHGTQQGEYFGIPPTGKDVTISGVDIFKVQDGKLTELYLEPNFLGLLHQLGVVPIGE